MSDLIDRATVFEIFNRMREDFLTRENFSSREEFQHCKKSFSDMADKLEGLPSAQPEIVRCKDCKHYQFADNRAFGMPVKMCEWFGFEDVDDDDFCSRAERRTDE